MASRKKSGKSAAAKKALAASMTRPERRKAAIAAGVAAADAALALGKVPVKAAAGPPKGLLVAEGDSWFDYPLHDVLQKLEQLNWRIVSVAHRGDTVESMAYDGPQFVRLEKELRRLAGQQQEPHAILLSGGGNDIAGDEFSMLLNHKNSHLPPLNQQVLAGVFEERIEAAILSLVAGVTRLSEELFAKKVKIVLHGYGHPVPDGRGFLGGFGPFPGPWLRPGFRRKGYDDTPADLKTMTDLMAVLIDRFNAVLQSIAGSPTLGHVQYIDLRPLISNTLPKKYQDDWGNELHLTSSGFTRVAKAIDAAI
jgi:hypothetical protein